MNFGLITIMTQGLKILVSWN